MKQQARSRHRSFSLPHSPVARVHAVVSPFRVRGLRGDAQAQWRRRRRRAGVLTSARVSVKPPPHPGLDWASSRKTPPHRNSRRGSFEEEYAAAARRASLGGGGETSRDRRALNHNKKKERKTAAGLYGRDAERSDGGRGFGFPDGRCWRLVHLPHAVLRPAQERLRGAQGPALQDRGDEHLQDGQARPCQGPHGRDRHLQWKEARRHLPFNSQHGRAEHQEERLPADRDPGRIPLSAPGQRGGAGGPEAARGRAGQGDGEQVRGRGGDPDHCSVCYERRVRRRYQGHD